MVVQLSTEATMLRQSDQKGIMKGIMAKRCQILPSEHHKRAKFDFGVLVCCFCWSVVFVSSPVTSAD